MELIFQMLFKFSGILVELNGMMKIAAIRKIAGKQWDWLVKFFLSSTQNVEKILG